MKNQSLALAAMVAIAMATASVSDAGRPKSLYNNGKAKKTVNKSEQKLEKAATKFPKLAEKAQKAIDKGKEDKAQQAWDKAADKVFGKVRDDIQKRGYSRYFEEVLQMVEDIVDEIKTPLGELGPSGVASTNDFKLEFARDQAIELADAIQDSDFAYYANSMPYETIGNTGNLLFNEYTEVPINNSFQDPRDSFDSIRLKAKGNRYCYTLVVVEVCVIAVAKVDWVEIHYNDPNTPPLRLDTFDVILGDGQGSVDISFPETDDISHVIIKAKSFAPSSYLGDGVKVKADLGRPQLEI